ncbi:unnamed protein product [Microthlaspi erraticum]|uniref:DUF1677 domain-containing protein n=1 Tax=Microthlaspi erraticum TaxID=1685480 RepID=A0A6D2I7X3_9BRAS|nr:unnamed protein product [Microthlaspi erraticum]
MDRLQRTFSDISHQLSTDTILTKEPSPAATATTLLSLAAITEVEDAKCECCGMSEECTPEYINRVRSKYSGKLICGLCSDAVEEEIEKMSNSEVVVEKRREEAVKIHMGACARFNKLGRSYPVLYQAEAVKEMLKKRSKKIIRDTKSSEKGGLARSSSCMPALAKELKDQLDRPNIKQMSEKRVMEIAEGSNVGVREVMGMLKTYKRKRQRRGWRLRISLRRRQQTYGNGFSL